MGTGSSISGEKEWGAFQVEVSTQSVAWSFSPETLPALLRYSSTLSIPTTLLVVVSQSEQNSVDNELFHLAFPDLAW